MSKYVNARDLREPTALPKELRRIATRHTEPGEIRDILEHAADELELLQSAAIQPQCAPDREALVRAIQLSYARKDLEPTSATTLALYREDAEHAADAVLALTQARPERGDSNAD